MERVFLCLALLFSFFFGPFGCVSACANDYVDEFAKMRNSSVSIQVDLYGSKHILGSGTISLASDSSKKHPKYVVITAQHVAEVLKELGVDAYACEILEPDNCVVIKEFSSGVDTGDLCDDWAVFPISDIPKGMFPAKINNKSLQPGEKVFIAGHPYGMVFFSEGIVSHLAYYADERNTVYAMHSFAGPGSSGGGVFDTKGRLIGILVAREIVDVRGTWTDLEDFVYVVPISRVVW